jgi:hypothetical protein
MVFSTMMTWMFYRSMPKDEALLNCLSYYREGLNAAEAEIASQEVLSFFKVFEIEFRGFERREIGPKTQKWITEVFSDACNIVQPEYLKQFHIDRQDDDVAKYLYKNCRVAVAHASKEYPSDADMSFETRRLSVAAEILRALARHYIRTTFDFSDSYLSDQSSR